MERINFQINRIQVFFYLRYRYIFKCKKSTINLVTSFLTMIEHSYLWREKTPVEFQLFMDVEYYT